jgi:hypothetical protein
VREKLADEQKAKETENLKKRKASHAENYVVVHLCKSKLTKGCVTFNL